MLFFLFSWIYLLRFSVSPFPLMSRSRGGARGRGVFLLSLTALCQVESLKYNLPRSRFKSSPEGQCESWSVSWWCQRCHWQREVLTRSQSLSCASSKHWKTLNIGVLNKMIHPATTEQRMVLNQVTTAKMHQKLGTGYLSFEFGHNSYLSQTSNITEILVLYQTFPIS